MVPGRIAVAVILSVLLLVWASPRGRAAEVPELCGLLWQMPMPATRTPEVLEEVIVLRDQGKAKDAARIFEERVGSLLESGTRMMQDPKLPVADARGFMEKYVRNRRPLLTVRGDLLTPTLEVETLGARLLCDAGRHDQGLVWLRAAWRDFARSELHQNLMLMYLAAGRIDRAAEFIPDNPVGWREKAGTGHFLCATGARSEGLGLLVQARELAPDSETRTRIDSLVEKCR